MIPSEPRSVTVCGFACTVNDALGHIEVAHDGSITWDQLQAVKNAVWGEGARAIEVYPAQADLVNGGNYRHLWRLAADEFCPDLLLGFQAITAFNPDSDQLQMRVVRAWLGDDWKTA